MLLRAVRTGWAAFALLFFVCRVNTTLFPPCPERHDLARIAPHGPGDATGDAVGRRLERVAGELRVARRRGGVSVPQQRRSAPGSRPCRRPWTQSCAAGRAAARHRARRAHATGATPSRARRSVCPAPLPAGRKGCPRSVTAPTGARSRVPVACRQQDRGAEWKHGARRRSIANTAVRRFSRNGLNYSRYS